MGAGRYKRSKLSTGGTVKKVAHCKRAGAAHEEDNGRYYKSQDPYRLEQNKVKRQDGSRRSCFERAVHAFTRVRVRGRGEYSQRQGCATEG